MTERSTDILVIGDDPLFVATACEVLRERGLAVRSAVTAEEGLEALAQGRAPKLIVVDLVLPDISARGVLAVVRKEVTWSRTPVVLVTAAAVEGVPGDLQVDGVVLKPVGAGQLVSLAHRYCRRA